MKHSLAEIIPAGRAGTLALLLAIAITPMLIPAKLTAQPRKKVVLPAKIDLRGSFRNGTTNRPARVTKLELIALQGGMQIMQVRENIGPTFTFTGLKRPATPMLLRATFRGERYVAMIPPAPRFWKKRHLITVFEKKPLGVDTRVSAAMQISRTAEGLRVSKIFAIANKTRYTSGTDAFFIPLPADAKKVRGSLEHDATRIPAPLSLTKTPRGYRINRGFRPGNSALRIEFSVDGHEFKDRFHVLPELPAERFQMIWWRPTDAKPRVTGGKVTERNIPRLGPALRVDYPPNAVVAYDFNQGGVIVDNPMTSDVNPIFDSGLKTVVGMLVFLVFFFAVLSILSATGLKVVRKD